MCIIIGALCLLGSTKVNYEFTVLLVTFPLIAAGITLALLTATKRNAFNDQE
uniref:Uncharacterized protein n=1 Tax=Rhizobium phage IG49 TaxID=3129228 RepID=A0AAU8HZK2_9CAUD